MGWIGFINDIMDWVNNRINEFWSRIESGFLSLKKWTEETFPGLKSLFDSLIADAKKTVLDIIRLDLKSVIADVVSIKNYLTNIWLAVRPYVISELLSFKASMDQRLGDIDRSIYVMRTDFEQWKRDFIGNLNSFVFSIIEGWVKEFTTGFEKGLEEK